MGSGQVETFFGKSPFYDPDRTRLTQESTQRAVNRNVWKQVQILQGYDCDIIRIVGKAKIADFLSRCSVKELKNMVDVRSLEELMVQRLQLGDGQVMDEKIEEKLDEFFKGQMGQVNYLHSLHYFS